MDAQFLEQASSYLNNALIAVLIARLWRTGLHKIYRFFFVFLLAELIQFVLRFLHRLHPVYVGGDSTLYMAGQVVKIVLMVFVLREICRMAFQNYPALAQFSKRSAGYVVSVCGVIALLLMGIDPSVRWDIGHSLLHFLTFERTMDSAILAFLLAVSLFMAWFPVRVRRNVAVYLGGFAAYYTVHWVSLFLMNRNVLNDTWWWIETMMLTVSSLCILAWIVLLGPKGEHTTTVTGHRWNPQALERLSRQLADINANLAGRFLRSILG